MEELRTCELAEPFRFTKGCKTLKVKAEPFFSSQHEHGNLLFDLKRDPQQDNPIQDEELEQEMIKTMRTLMIENDAPPEQFERIGINHER